MSAVAVVVAVALGTAALLAVGRIIRGPSLLDRVVAAEVLIAIIVGGIAAEAAINQHATTLPVLVVLSLLGFVGTVSIVRFVAARSAAVAAAERREEQ
ncbi:MULTISPECIES: monovalent cation/H+ antiporter complex subunit F [unclassified Solwaraspora]|uniref:monovalent cation/H+ antiporter complex subunit F n=1 Tax=unclassified Solwaraspora TaxID=2627926 RepID=UPI00259BC59C|nr:monovalent cation/H+ antiporter complex subunit F [Solwaraspora sp. WMMA2056]WJK39884.1 monovalent cation/H+ antiporter complex subunit F [Solwaraspora sp. WMMA2056]